jgi:carbon-monoxide dehydrogenase small subunit
MAVKVSMKVNGKAVSAEVEERTLLVTFIRENLRLTGTHVGCDTAQCGACTVHMNGRAVKACSIVAMQAEGADILTIEGVAEPDGTLHPMQAAFKEHHGLQCGYCTPGMMLVGAALIQDNPMPSDDEVRVAISGNICRCTGYMNIVKAIQAAAQASSGATVDA